MSELPLIVETGSGGVDGCVIWLHGLGADGYDFEPIVAELNLPESMCIRFVFPHASMMPVTINNGFTMRAWYDINSMDIASDQDEVGVRDSQKKLINMIDKQVLSGINRDRIVLAGFSQGGAIAYQTALRLDKSLAGLMVLSCYLPLDDSFAVEKTAENLSTPIFLAHGDCDPVVPPELAYKSRSLLEKNGYQQLEWHEYPDMQHSVCMQEINDISKWLQKIFN